MSGHSDQDKVVRFDVHASDAVLLERAHGGDHEAFGVLVERYTPVVLGYLAGRTRDWSEREELLQEVMYEAYRQLGRLQDVRQLGAWLTRIARNKQIDRWRLESAEKRGGAVNRVPWADGHGRGAGDPQADAAAEEIRATLLEELGRMKDGLRTVLYLRLVEEASTPEIARQLGLREGTVRMRLKRGLATLRKQMERRGIGPSMKE